MAELKKLFAQYASVSHEDLFRNLQYFLKAVIPVCEQYDVKLAIHPDDPPWDIFGLPASVPTPRMSAASCRWWTVPIMG